MAFKIDTETLQGLMATAAYCRVENVHVTKDNVSFALRRYKDSTADQFLFDTYYSAPYALTGVNPIQQSYLHLKSLPEFAGAFDVLEAGQPQQ